MQSPGQFSQFVRMELDFSLIYDLSLNKFLFPNIKNLNVALQFD